MLFRTMDGRRHSLPYSVRGCRAFRRICDALFCDAMSPEFKKANDIPLKAIKLNDRTDGLSHLLLEHVGKALKANDGKKASDALAKVLAKVNDATKARQAAISEADDALADATKAANDGKETLKKAKAAIAAFDRARAACDAAKADPKKAARLGATFDRHKAAIGDFTSRTSKIAQAVAAKKDASKLIESPAKAVDAAKKKAERELAKVEKSAKDAVNKLAVKKEMAKIARNKAAMFEKEKLMLGQLRSALPSERVVHGETGNVEAQKKKAMEFLNKRMRPVYEKAMARIDSEGARLKEKANALYEKLKAACKKASGEIHGEANNLNKYPYGGSIVNTIRKVAGRLSRVDGLIIKDVKELLESTIPEFRALEKRNPPEFDEFKKDYMHALSTFKTNRLAIEELQNERKEFAGTGITPTINAQMENGVFLKRNDKQTYDAIIGKLAADLSSLQKELVKIIPIEPVKTDRLPLTSALVTLEGRIGKYGAPKPQMSGNDRQFFS